MQLLTRAESPAHVFQIIYQRFPVPPAVVFYDRSCQLHTYVVKREPHHFQNTIFRIDITHAQTHTACAETYDPKLFRNDKAHSSKHTEVNTQICEQTNSLLTKIRGVSGFMTQERFMLFNRLLLYKHNIQKKDAIKQKQKSQVLKA